MAALLPQTFLMVVERQLQAFEQIMGEQHLQMVKQRAVWQLQTVEQTVELIAGRAPQTLQREQTQDQKVQSPLAEATLTATAQGTQLAQGAVAGAVHCRPSVQVMAVICSPQLAE